MNDTLAERTDAALAEMLKRHNAEVDGCQKTLESLYRRIGDIELEIMRRDTGIREGNRVRVRDGRVGVVVGLGPRLGRLAAEVDVPGMATLYSTWADMLETVDD